MITVEDLNAIKNKMKNDMRVREDNPKVTHVLVGMGTCGIAKGAKNILSAFIDEILKENLEHITVTQMPCIGLCSFEPVVKIKEPEKDPVIYVNVTEQKAREIVEKHLKNKEPVTEYILGEES